MPACNGVSQSVEFRVTRLDRSFFQHALPREDLTKGLLASASGPDNCHRVVQCQFRIDILKQHEACVIGNAYVLHVDLVEVWRCCCQFRARLGRPHAFGVELLHHLVVLDLHVLTLEVPVNQLLDRAWQVLVRDDHGDKLSDVKLSRDDEVTTGRVEYERRKLGNEIVQRLDEVFALVEFKTDVEDARKAPDDFRPFPICGSLHPDVGVAVDDLADPPCKLPRLQLSHLAKLEDGLS